MNEILVHIKKKSYMNDIIEIHTPAKKAIYVPEKLWHMLKNKAISDGMNITKLMEDMFEIYRAREPKQFDVQVYWLFIPMSVYELWTGALSTINGVYVYYDEHNPLYIGQTQTSYMQRIEEHRRNGDKYHNDCYGVRISFLVYDENEFYDRDVLYRQIEDYMIEKYKPRYNERLVNTCRRYKHMDIVEHMLE